MSSPPIFTSKWYNDDLDATRHRTVLVNAGGAITMKKSALGYQPQAGVMEAYLHANDLLFRPDLPAWAVVELPELKDSSNWDLCDWDSVADVIKSVYYSCDSIVLIMGTDTMAYAAAGLSFMLENITKPIILTGAMVPMEQTRSDAMLNVLGAMQVAMEAAIPEVCVFFSGHLFRGNRVTKVRSTSYIGAFMSPNYPPLGNIGVGVTINPSAAQSAGRGPFNARYIVRNSERQPKVMVLRLFPGIEESWIKKILACKPQGIVMESFGSGNAPTHIVSMLGNAIANDGVTIVNITQCLVGSVVQEAYLVGSYLATAGIISGHDLTTEAAYAKLAFLIGQGYDQDKVAYLMGVNLTGELFESQ